MGTNLLVGHEDRFGGIIVDSTRESVSGPDEFSKRLAYSLQHWLTAGVRGVWFKVHLQNSSWIPILAKNEFIFHHAQSEYVMMMRWLPKGEPCAIPSYPHNYVGVGAFVVNDSDEVLVVKERYFIDKPRWKLPGGYVEFSEELCDAAEREVFEETGIKSKFVSLIAFRHMHGVQFKCSDLYFVCQLQPLSDTISKCERELLDCKWMPIQDFCKDPEINIANHYLAKCFIENKAKGIVFSPLKMEYCGLKQCVYAMTDYNFLQKM